MNPVAFAIVEGAGVLAGAHLYASGCWIAALVMWGLFGLLWLWPSKKKEVE